jgi:hypothetical protein
MDLGMTALGNWKAQQGGCTHIQVRSPTPILDRNWRVSQGGRIPFSPPPPPPPPLPPFFRPTCSSSTRSTTSSTFPFLTLPYLDRTDPQEPFGKLFVCCVLLLTHHPNPITHLLFTLACPDFCFRFRFRFPLSPVEKVHELRHGILQALPQAKPSYGGTRRPRIAYTLQIYHIFLAVVFVVRRCFLARIRHSQSHRTQSL